ncbi:BafA family autotransporter [Bartonella harrusi]|uniref:BafA family autotransporter n=1 Tax=Bartonella harrusi TaxID=2961895 RepID=A0ABY5EX89_9HYPH|nr:BafA family autotransporter [Bartonella harrusi]UTO29170.1 BafA family autotransporter [Bartonella harrusi]
MQRKLKLSFGVLMTSSFIVKVAIADEVFTSKGSPLMPAEVNKKLKEVGNFIPKIIGLKEKSGKSERVPNKQIAEISGLPEEERRGIKSFSFKALTNSIIYGNTDIYITDYSLESSGKKVKSFNYKNAGYSINNTVRNGGRLHINEASVSRDTTIENGDIEFVKNLSISEYAIIKKGGKQIVGNGASAEGAKIYGGEQVVFGKHDPVFERYDISKDPISSTAYDTVIYGQNGRLGYQNVYSDGQAVNTKIMRGGVQNLNGTESFNNEYTENVDAENDKFSLIEGASALNTEIFKNGIQNILPGGMASGVTLYDNATQEIYNTGYVDTLTINDQAKSWLHAGAILDKETKVNDFGSLHIYAGDGGAVTEIENLILDGEDVRLYSIAVGNNGKKQTNIKNLSGSGRVIFTSIGDDQQYSELHVDNLSGNLHFDFNVSFSEKRGDYLLIKNSGAGHHTISVIDSGVEITNFFRKKLKLISDRSGGAHFTLTNVFGEKINAFDVGTYMYRLKHRKNKKNGKIWYLDARYTFDETIFPVSYVKPSDTSSSDYILTDFTIDKGKVVSVGNPNSVNDTEKDSNIGSYEESISNTVKNGGKLYVYNGGYSLYTKIENRGAEIISGQGISQDTDVCKGGQQKVENGGKVEEAKIYGGEQFVSGKVDIKGEMVRSSAEGTIISAQDEVLGYQNVYDGGVVFNTKIMEGGVQNLYGEDDLNEEDYGGTAFNTEVFSGGEQNVLVGGEAMGVILHGTAIQKIELGGYAKDLTVKDQAKAWLHHGATLEGKTTVNDSGRIYLYAGADRSRTEVENIILNGKDAKLYSIASSIDGESSLVENLSGSGSVIFTSNIFNPHYSKLEINDLSGNLHFRFHINFAEQRGDYLFIKNGMGSHTISVIDSGIEIANFSPQKDTFVNEFNLVTDQSGGAHFTLVDFLDEEISVIDAGAYMYSLNQKNDEGGKIWYLAITNNFHTDKNKLILQNCFISDGSIVYISDDGEMDHYKKSINNTVQDTGIIHVKAGGLSKNTTIKSGGTEIVREQGIAEFSIIHIAGQQRVEDGGIAVQTEIHGGKQFVFGGGYIDGGIVGSSAYKTKIYGQGEVLGQQNVYGDGVVWETKVMSGGIQNIALWFPDDDDFSLKNGGLALNTEVFAGGMQRVLVGGKADTVILHSNAVQEVHAGGFVKNLTIEDGAKSWIFSGAMLSGKTIVNDFGQFHLYAGDDDHQTIAENIHLNGEEARLYSIGTEFDGKRSFIQKLSGMGKIIFTSVESEVYYSRLYVDDLSGNMHFNFNVSLAEGDGDYLFIKNGSGNHTITVVDSGIEIANPVSTNLDLIVDQSGGTHFTLQRFSGAKIETVDGGTYTYSLKKKNGENEEAKVWYLTAAPIDNIPSKNKIPSHSDRGKRPFTPSTVPSLQDQVVELFIRPSQFSSSLREELSKSDFLTTPSTDAVLSLSVAPQFVFHNELQTVRAGRGILERSKKSSVLWASAIKSKESVSTGHLDFKLEQTGVVLGLTALSELTNGDFYLGGFGSYDQGRVAHARGGTSSVNTYGIGAYATYFSQSGWYLDGILKYNHYQNTLKAVSTNGLDIEGNYKQWAMGASFEGGYRVKMAQSSWMQPYAQLTWLRAEGKEITLSNKMIGNINPLTSLRSEVGLSLGYEFGSDLDFSSIAYITAAWLRENKNDNHTTINKQHKFTTDLSGNAGKLGIGLSSLVSDKLKLYAEAHYVKGRKVKQLLQGTLGMRYSF